MARGAKKRDPSMGRARLATSSTGRWDLSFKGGRSVFQESGIRLGERRVQRALWESGTLGLSREQKVLPRRPAAGLMVGVAQTSLRAAIIL